MLTHFCLLKNGKITPKKATCRENFTSTRPFRGRGKLGRSSWPGLITVFFTLPWEEINKKGYLSVRLTETVDPCWKLCFPALRSPIKEVKCWEDQKCPSLGKWERKRQIWSGVEAFFGQQKQMEAPLSGQSPNQPKTSHTHWHPKNPRVKPVEERQLQCQKMNCNQTALQVYLLRPGEEKLSWRRRESQAP